MNIPPPSERQAKLLWFSLTALAVGVLAGLLGVLTWGVGQVIQVLTPVLLPLAAAGIIAYLLDPIVTFFVRRGQPRLRSIFYVFGLIIVLAAGLGATVVPRLVIEAREVVDKAPEYSKALNQRASDWLAKSQWAQDLIQQNTASPASGTSSTPAVISWLNNIFPAISEWFVTQTKRFASWIGLMLGLFLVPVYVFYFLLERDSIERGWRDYLPITNKAIKDEVVFIISSINDSLIVFFRGQALVSCCSGTLLTIAFMSMNLNYGLFLGILAGVLGIIPYLGAAISLVPALTIAAVQYQDWVHPVMVLAAFGLVNLFEGLVVSPKIIGDRVGLHPLAIMIAIMIGTTLMGGLLGGLLAIPLTAALRSMMSRYVWNEPGARPKSARRSVVS